MKVHFVQGEMSQEKLLKFMGIHIQLTTNYSVDIIRKPNGKVNRNFLAINWKFLAHLVINVFWPHNMPFFLPLAKHPHDDNSKVHRNHQRQRERNAGVMSREGSSRGDGGASGVPLADGHRIPITGGWTVRLL